MYCELAIDLAIDFTSSSERDATSLMKCGFDLVISTPPSSSVSGTNFLRSVSRILLGAANDIVYIYGKSFTI